MHCGRRKTGLLTTLLVGTQLTKVSPVETVELQVGEGQCSECGYHLDRNFAWCPNCGTRSKPYQCAYCHGLVPIEAESCDHCGAPLD